MEDLKDELKGIFGDLRFDCGERGEIYTDVSQKDIYGVVGVLAEKKFGLLCMFAVDNLAKEKTTALLYAFEKRGHDDIFVIRCEVEKEAVSIAGFFPSACFYEREVMDGFGISFLGLYDKRRLFLHETYPKTFYPLRKSFKNGPADAGESAPFEEYEFKEVRGEGVYQIPVGPVHAGIIEPGHFRFSVIGETIFNLEIRMFWKHRGIEKLSEDKSPEKTLLLAEAISGDETVANSLAYCNAVEKICRIKVPQRAEYIRAIFAETERIYALLGDLGGMLVDVAYPTAAINFFILREEILRWNGVLSKSRFYKNALKIGGVSIDIEEDVLKRLMSFLGRFSADFKHHVEQSLASASVIDRFETTGKVRKDIIWPLNISGPLARASGEPADVRTDHPYGVYVSIPPKKIVFSQGDVLDRFNVKVATVEDSIRIIRKAIGDLPEGEICAPYEIRDGYAFSMAESARGQNIHFVHIRGNVISRYKVRTASFCNWQAIEHAVMGNIVPDFPLINKSMNLSYAGTDM